MNEVKVSIIVPVYKTEKYLERCIDSLKKQTLREIEIILVDDGSPDNCPEMCDSAAESDSRIKVVHKKNGGLGEARNTGLEYAVGEYVGFVDSDDFVDENMFGELYRAAEKYGADIAVSGLRFVDGNMFSEKGRSGGSDYEHNYFVSETVFDGRDGMNEFMRGTVGALSHEKLDSRYGMSVCKDIFRRRTAEENRVRFMSEREVLSEDALFLLDFAKCADRIVGLPCAHYSYCRNGESLSKSYDANRLEKSVIFVNEVEKRLACRMPESEYREYLDRLRQAFGRVLCSQTIMYASECGMKYGELRSRLKEICETPEIAKALGHYPWYRLPRMQAAFAFLMKYRLYALAVLAVKFRENLNSGKG